MKFVPKRLDETQDISRGNTNLRVFGRVLVVAGVVGVLLILLLAFVFEQAAVHLSDEAEQKYLAWITESIPTLAVNDDADLAEKYDRAQHVLRKLMSQGYERDLPYELKFIDFPEPNAFAAPGGLIAISPALFDWVETEEGLAFVLAHELAHHEARHVGRRMARGMLVILVQLMLDGSVGNTSIDWMGQLAVAQYSQSQEYDADSLALKRLAQLYPDLSNATEFLERALDAADDFPIAVGIWQSHPPTAERLERVHAQIRGLHKGTRSSE